MYISLSFSLSLFFSFSCWFVCSFFAGTVTHVYDACPAGKYYTNPFSTTSPVGALSNCTSCPQGHFCRYMSGLSCCVSCFLFAFFLFLFLFLLLLPPLLELTHETTTPHRTAALCSTNARHHLWNKAKCAKFIHTFSHWTCSFFFSFLQRGSLPRV